jgi:TetR/AcrR family transcriptional regulator, cholesterol catabolism regulator
MKELTERQKRRRADILAAARALIAERGYEGVTMRDLAARSDVALKTLYQQYDSKENLLSKAVEELHSEVYDQFELVEKETGIEKLLYIVHQIFKLTIENDAYAKTMAPIMALGSTGALAETRTAVYRQAIHQMIADDGIIAGVDPEILLSILLRQWTAIYLEWARSSTPSEQVAITVQLQMCLVLASLTKGDTHRIVSETITALLPKLGGSSAAQNT